MIPNLYLKYTPLFALNVSEMVQGRHIVDYYAICRMVSFPIP